MIEVSVAHNTARLEGSLSYLRTGTESAKIQVYATERPAFGAAAGALPLVEIILIPTVGEIVSGMLTIEAVEDALITMSGIAVWARVRNRNGDIAFDCDVSVEGGMGEVQLPGLQLFAGGLTRLVSAVLG